MNKISRFSTFILAAVLLLGCKPDNPTVTPKPDTPKDTTSVAPPTAKSEDVTTWVTTENEVYKFSKSTSEFGNAGSMSPYVVKLDPSTTYQTVDGFGAAVTGASCYNLLKMKQDERTAFLKQIFDREEGFGSSLIRISIGASDFSVDSDFTWCDTEGLENFAPHYEDEAYLFPILKEIYAINPDVKIIGSPWSAPRWMKESNSWTSASLKTEYYDEYAEYIVKWIEFMENQGFNIYAITPQNEPLNRGNSMSMYMGWEQQRDFIMELGPAIEKAGLKTKILCFDHNYNYDNKDDQYEYPIQLYDDPDVSKYIAGSAWHNYGGRVTELDKYVSLYPEKEIYFTEASIGEWNHASFGANFLADFESIFFGPLQRMSKGSTVWNLMLDDKRGPHRGAGACKTCFGVVDINSSNYSTLKYNTHYYHIGHTSSVIKPGAVRIGTSGFTKSEIPYMVFKNTDGSYGLIIMNKSNTGQQFVFSGNGYTVKVDSQAKSITSVLWEE